MSSFTRDLVQSILAQRNSVLSSPVIDRMRYPTAHFEPRDQDAIEAAAAELSRSAPELDHAITLFDDRASVELVRRLLAFRILGPCRHALPLSTDEYIAQYDAEARYRTGRSPPRGRWALSTFDIPFMGENLSLEIWDGNLAAVFLRKQYFFERDGVRIAPAAGDMVLDCGACLGDTTLAFAAAVGPRGKVAAFEPIEENLQFLRGNLARNPAMAERIILVEKAISENSGTALMQAEDAGSNMSAGGDIECETVGIDDFSRSQPDRKVDFIKMDIEGHESPALLGASGVLADMQPRLAISAYHWPTDLWTLPALIKRLNPRYRLYLDHHSNHAEETVLYAI